MGLSALAAVPIRRRTRTSFLHTSGTPTMVRHDDSVALEGRNQLQVERERQRRQMKEEKEQRQ